MGKRSSRAISETMRRVKSTHTSAELRLRKALWLRGLRYRLHPAGLPGKPDIVLPTHRVAIFVDGDFWHGNQWRIRGLSCLEDQFRGNPNAAYWISKIKRNVERDRQWDELLAQQGWKVVRCWESEIRKDLPGCVQRVVEAISG